MHLLWQKEGVLNIALEDFCDNRIVFEGSLLLGWHNISFLSPGVFTNSSHATGPREYLSLIDEHYCLALAQSVLCVLREVHYKKNPYCLQCLLITQRVRAKSVTLVCVT